MKFIGLDAGSVSVKLVVLDEKGSKTQGFYARHKGHPLKVSLELLETVVSGNVQQRGSETPGSDQFSLSVTGSSGRWIANALGIGFTNEVIAQTYATRKLSPSTKTIIELGGEDSKLIVFGEKGIKDFSM
ncbi:MAG TPA: hypothetical protein VMU21_09050, partial [Thermodesulfovibrionales bacterium]|nr:hypothetical protein [Thermodesulfovibrionales bacterium]